jgi:hypothetical protein
MPNLTQTCSDDATKENSIERFQKALNRNLYELSIAISMRNGLNELSKAAPKLYWSFFAYSYIALYDGYLSHAIKVLDRHKDAASFLCIRNCEMKLVNSLLKKKGMSLPDINVLVDKLTHVRDKTLFHIDKHGVDNSAKIWEEADIKGILINSIVDNIWEILNDIHREKYGKEYISPIYKGKDVAKIVEVCRSARIEI